jgi:hypothetical protein
MTVVMMVVMTVVVMTEVIKTVHLLCKFKKYYTNI